MPLHFKPTATGLVKITDHTIYDPGQVFLAVGDLTGSSLDQWISIIDAPLFDSDSTELENLLGLRRPDRISYVTEKSGVKASFTIADIDNLGVASRYFRLVANGVEYCVWIDSTGFDTNPTNESSQTSLKISGIGGADVAENLAVALNALSSLTANNVAGTVTVTGADSGVITIIDVSTSFTFTTLVAGVDEGNIRASGKYYILSDTPTNVILLQYHIDAENIPTATIYQLGLYQDSTFVSGVNAGDMFMGVDSIATLGTFIGGTNCYPIERAANRQNIVNIILNTD